MNEDKMVKLMEEVVSLLKGMREDQVKIFHLLNKYDDAYLAEVEKDRYLKED